MPKRETPALIRCTLRPTSFPHERWYTTKHHEGIVQECHIQDGCLKVLLLGDGTAHLCESIESVRITVDDDEIAATQQMVWVPTKPKGIITVGGWTPISERL